MTVGGKERAGETHTESELKIGVQKEATGLEEDVNPRESRISTVGDSWFSV